MAAASRALRVMRYTRCAVRRAATSPDAAHGRQKRLGPSVVAVIVKLFGGSVLKNWLES
jgi:hypothetical protein